MGWDLAATYQGQWSIANSLPGAAIDSSGNLLVNWFEKNTNQLNYIYPLSLSAGAVQAPPSVVIQNNQSSGSPAAIFCGGACYFFWRGYAGNAGDDHVYWGVVDLVKGQMQPGTQYPNGATADGPVVVSSSADNSRLGSSLVAAWRGSQISQDPRLYITTLPVSNGVPRPTTTIPMDLVPADFGFYSPSIVVVPEGATFAAWTGSGDNGVYWSVSLDPRQSTFTPNMRISGIQSVDRVSLTVVTGVQRQLVLVYRNPSNTLMYAIGTYDASFNVSWAPPQRVSPASEMSVPAGVWAAPTNVTQTSAYYVVGDRTTDGEIDDFLTLLVFTPD